MKRIVILGAGFGGLRAAVSIAKKLRVLNLTAAYELTLVDRNEFHIYTPLLYEVATTSPETATQRELYAVTTHHIHSLIAWLPIMFLKGTVETVDVVHRAVHVSGNTIPFDYLVIALGSETNYFDIPGLKEHALPLKTFSDALRIRGNIFDFAQKYPGVMQIVVGGGGSVGIELAAEIKEWCGQLQEQFSRCTFDVTIIEGNRTVLFGMDPRVVRAVAHRLQKLGVRLLMNERIASAEKNRVRLQGGKAVPFDLLVWAGGVKAPAVLSAAPLERESRSRIVVSGEMECLPQTPDLKLARRIYALGDSICFYDPVTKKPIPGVARAAILQANIVAHNLIEDIQAESGIGELAQRRTYAPMEYPYITPVGGKYAVAKVGPIVISGFFGWVLKGLVELNYLLSIMPVRVALRVWLKGLKIFIQNDRLG